MQDLQDSPGSKVLIMIEVQSQHWWKDMNHDVRNYPSAQGRSAIAKQAPFVYRKTSVAKELFVHQALCLVELNSSGSDWGSMSIK